MTHSPFELSQPPTQQLESVRGTSSVPQDPEPRTATLFSSVLAFGQDRHRAADAASQHEGAKDEQRLDLDRKHLTERRRRDLSLTTKKPTRRKLDLIISKTLASVQSGWKALSPFHTPQDATEALRRQAVG